ncbi:MAG: hypothetical protein CM15mP120_29840 [Pseudomonadota bacterium]|nr:MAG: hypothetical protein CM15mP120_29840 [Pseudomonadota bacterium]
MTKEIVEVRDYTIDADWLTPIGNGLPSWQYPGCGSLYLVDF